MIDVVVHDAYYEQWGQVVLWGALMLALGTSVFWIGCLRLARIGHPIAAVVLALAGGLLAVGSNLAALYPAFTSPLRWIDPNLDVLGLPIPNPDLWFLPADAVSWGLLSPSLAIVGVGLATIRRRPPQRPSGG